MSAQPCVRREGVIAVVGDLVEDIVVWGAHEIERATDTPAQIFRSQGGSAANVAVAIARIGALSRFIGRVGMDKPGEMLEQALRDVGVDTRLQRGGRTGTIVVLIGSDGERSMLPDRGASSELDPIQENWLDGVAWLHLPFYGFEAEEQAQIRIDLATIARGRSIPISVDASSVALLRSMGRGVVDQYLRALAPAVVFANADEARFLELEARIQQFPCTVIKRGPDPLDLIINGHRERVDVPHVSAVRDTTGAGDAFAAGFLATMINRGSPPDAAKSGVAAAARVLSTPGAGW